MKNSKESLEGAYNNALDLILNKRLKEEEKVNISLEEVQKWHLKLMEIF